MGIQVLATPVASVNALVPVNKDVSIKVFQIARTDTASSVKLVLPADATILQVYRNGSVASDSATSSTGTTTIANQSGTITTLTDNVKANGAAYANFPSVGLPNAQPTPLAGDITISAIYAEVGASTVGGPWTYIVEYVR